MLLVETVAEEMLHSYIPIDSIFIDNRVIYHRFERSA